MFRSSLATEMRSYIELRTGILSRGTVSNDRRSLSLLDHYLVSQNYTGKELTEEILHGWILTLSGKSKTVKEKIRAVRCFIQYLNSLGCHSSFLPDNPKVKSDYIPYIFSDQEFQQIIYYADHLGVLFPHNCCAKYPVIVPMVIRILYGCGTRLGETMSLQRMDIDFANGTLLLRNTKYSKERMIPVHDSLLAILERYCLALGIMDKPEAFIFPGQKAGTHYSSRNVDDWFAKILKLADIDQRNKQRYERGACLHCFRHLFVLKSMQQLELAGRPVDMNDLLLPTYLGHKCLLDTDKYMRFSGVLLPDSLDAFENFTSGLIPEVEVPYEEE